jgi:hypothetical protein
LDVTNTRAALDANVVRRDQIRQGPEQHYRQNLLVGAHIHVVDTVQFLPADLDAALIAAAGFLRIRHIHTARRNCASAV